MCCGGCGRAACPTGARSPCCAPCSRAGSATPSPSCSCPLSPPAPNARSRPSARSPACYPQASDELVRTALLVCDDCDMSDQFRIGVDLMIGGLDAYLKTLEKDMPGNA